MIHSCNIARIAVAITFAGCAGMTPTGDDPPVTGNTTQAIVNAWCNETFNSLTVGGLDGQPSNNPQWAPVMPTDQSPNVFGPVTDGDHNNVVKLVNKSGNRSSAEKAISPNPADRFQNIVFQVRVNSDVPAGPSRKTALVFADDDQAAVVKFYFNGSNIELCGSNYQDIDCLQLFPNGVGDNGAPFQRIWYRVTVHLDLYVFNPTAYAEIGVVGDPHIITRTDLVTIESDPIQWLTMYEFGEEDGAVLLDNLLCYPQQ